MKEFIGLLDFLGWDANECMQYGFKHPDGKRQWFRNKVTAALTHMESVLQADIPVNMWYGINPVSPEGQGRAKGAEVTRVVSAYLDLDFKPDGLRNEKNAVTLVSKVQDALETDLLAMVHTGGGIQVYFPLSEDKSRDVYAARLTLKRVELLAQSIAHEEQLGHIDSVAELTRLFRVPGSKNQKYADKPEVFRVCALVASEQEVRVKWLRESDFPSAYVDLKKASET